MQKRPARIGSLRKPNGEPIIEPFEMSDERQLMRLLTQERPAPTEEHPLASDIASTFKMHERRLDSILTDWTQRGWWDCKFRGVDGWLTPLGLKVGRALLDQDWRRSIERATANQA